MYVSGGNKRLLEIMKRISEEEGVELYVFSTAEICQTFVRNGIRANYKIAPVFVKGTSNFRLLLDSIIRTFYSSITLYSSITVVFPNHKNVVIYSPSDFPWDTFPAYICKLRIGNNKCRWVQNIFHLIPSPIQRGGNFITNLASFSAQRLDLYLIRESGDLIFVLNGMVRDQLVKLGFSKNRIFVTGAGIDLSQIDEVPRAERMNFDACFLGRLHSSKGIFDLIEIWKLVVSEKKNAKLAIIYVGSKDLESALMKRIKEENLESNIFMLPLIGKDALGAVQV